MPLNRVPDKLSSAAGLAPSFSARAWVNFNGTGTVAIRASGNVSSITDNAVGDFTVNFASAMPDANYSVAGFVTSDDVLGSHQWGLLTSRQSSEHLAGSARVTSAVAYSANQVDFSLVSVAFFR